MDDLRAAGEQQVGNDQPHWEAADGRLPKRARACAATGVWPRWLTPRLALVGALSAFACTGSTTGPAPPELSREPITLTIGVPQSRQLDPDHGVGVLADSLAFERLTTSDGEGRTRPRLLEGWSVSGDGLTWRLFVRPDVKFQDGSPLTAGDIKRTFDAVIAEPASRNLRVCLPNVSSIDAASDREAVFTLTRRCSYLLDDLDRAISGTAADGTTLGTGAFSIASPSAEGMTLEANRHYHAGPPVIDRVVVKPFAALRTAWAEMMRGQVDFLWEVGPETAEFLSDRTAVEVRSFLGYYAYALMLNSARLPFSRAEVRQALNMAVDREAIVQQALKGRGVAADGPIWPRYWARDPAAPAMSFDRAEASAVLRGSRRGPVEFTCLVPANFSILERMALLVQQQLGEVNVRMRLESLPPDDFNQRIVSGRFDAVILPILGGRSPAVFHRFWHSAAGGVRRWNYWGYSNGRVDAALDAALDAVSDREFSDAIRRFETAVRDDPPAVFLAWNRTVQAVSRRFVVPADDAERDAIYLLNRFQLRPPGGTAR